jgi:hypothetical protein
MHQPGGSADDGAGTLEHREHLTHEAFTMALYVAICLLAALSLVDTASLDRGQIFELVWGTTVGLAVVHYFAFRVAGRMVTTEELVERAGSVALAQLSGSVIVAGVVTLALVVTPTDKELTVARFVVAALIGLMGYLVARPSTPSRWRAMLFGLLVLVLAAAVAALKVRLSK